MDLFRLLRDLAPRYSELPHVAWARRSLGEETPPYPVMLSEAKHLPKAKHLVLAGVEILRCPFAALRATAQNDATG